MSGSSSFFQSAAAARENSRSMAALVNRTFSADPEMVDVPMTCHLPVRKVETEIVQHNRPIPVDVNLTSERPQITYDKFYNDRVEEFPVKVTVQKPVLVPEIREVIKEVPKIVRRKIQRVVEVPEIQYVDRFEEVEEIEYHLKIVPKQEPPGEKHIYYCDATQQQRISFHPNPPIVLKTNPTIRTQNNSCPLSTCCDSKNDTLRSASNTMSIGFYAPSNQLYNEPANDTLFHQPLQHFVNNNVDPVYHCASSSKRNPEQYCATNLHKPLPPPVDVVNVPTYVPRITPTIVTPKPLKKTNTTTAKDYSLPKQI